MANIESKLTTIRSASGGEDVRDAIIGALRDINNDVPADMSNPIQIVEDMPQGTDLTIPINPPKLVSQILIKQPGSGGKSTTLNDITITENGEYPTDDEGYDPNKENRYYSKVTVKVPQLANAVLDLEEEITQNGTYSAPADWGVDGIRTFTVNVSGVTGDGPFKVEFYNKPQTDPTAAVIYTEIVPKGGNANFVGTTPTSSIGAFTGWNPTPSNVTRDMKCYPNFGQIIVDPTEIHDDWDVICANKGVGYPLGSHKLLAYGATFTPDEIRTYWPNYSSGPLSWNIYMMMYKVAEGESNSNSTWLSTRVMDNAYLGISKANNWADATTRNFLNGIFFNHMSDIFKNSIKQVRKYSLNNEGIMIPTDDKIWVPGAAEIGTYQTTPPGSRAYDFCGGTSWSGPYVDDIAKLDSVSVKYVRDYLNNDRNYTMAFTKDYLGGSGNGMWIFIRDNPMGEYVMYQRAYTGNDNYIGYNTQTEINRFNIGFCM